MRFFDFSSWQAILTSIAGILLVTLIGMGIRLIMMMTLQQRRERQNRQINERLKALVAAYKVLGGSFTGNLAVSPLHLRDLRRAAPPATPFDAPAGPAPVTGDAAPDPLAPAAPDPATAVQAQDPTPEAGDESEAEPLRSSERARRVRDAVEAALSDVVLFGTEEQVALAAAAMRDMAAGRPVHVNRLVVSLRSYIREVLDLDPIPKDVVIPDQGPARPSSSGARGGRGEGGREGGGGRGSGGGGGMGAGGMAMGGMGLGVGLGAGTQEEERGSG